MLELISVDTSHALDMDPNLDTKRTIMKKIDDTIALLTHDTRSLFAVYTTLYNIRKFGERIERYRDVLDNPNLSIEDCIEVTAYCKEATLKFLKEPLDQFKNIYLFDAATDKWIVVSPKGYLWLIYGDTTRKIRLIGQYLEKVLQDEDICVIDLKSVQAFVIKCIDSLFIHEGNIDVLTDVITNELFVTQYKKLLSMTKDKSEANNMSSSM